MTSSHGAGVKSKSLSCLEFAGSVVVLGFLERRRQ